MKVPVERLSECVIASPITSTPTFAELLMAIAAGCAEVYAASGRLADTVLMSKDRYYYVQGLAPEEWSAVMDSTPLRVVVEPRLLRGQIVVAHAKGMGKGDLFSCALITNGVA